MMNDKLKQMYVSGGLIKALLKDPKQREMAKKAIKEYDGGGMMEYGVGGMTEKPMKTMLGAPAGFKPGAKDAPSSKKMGVTTVAERQAQRDKARKARRYR